MTKQSRLKNQMDLRFEGVLYNNRTTKRLAMPFFGVDSPFIENDGFKLS